VRETKIERSPNKPKIERRTEYMVESRPVSENDAV